MNQKQFDKMCKEAREDFEADNDTEVDMQDAAPDMAECMLYTGEHPTIRLRRQ